MGERSNVGNIRPNIEWANLSPLERDVARLVAQDLPNGVIAYKLGKQTSHISRVVATLYIKSGVQPASEVGQPRRYGTRAKLIAWAKNQLASDDEGKTL